LRWKKLVGECVGKKGQVKWDAEKRISKKKKNLGGESEIRFSSPRSVRTKGKKTRIDSGPSVLRLCERTSLELARRDDPRKGDFRRGQEGARTLLGTTNETPLREKAWR